MILADVVAVIASLVGLLLAVPAVFLVARGVVPRIAEQCEGRFVRTPWLALLVGLPLQIPLLVPGLVLINVAPGPGKAVGFLWLGAAVGIALVGAGGLAARIGRHLRGPADDRRPWLGTVKGGLVLTLASGIPILGWFLILPLALIAGSGAAVLGTLFRLKERHSSGESAEATTPAAQVA